MRRAPAKRGVRYVNLGIPSASALTTRRFDRALAANDIAHLAPKLVVLGYGTNEGFIDGLDLDAYEKEYVHLLQLVKAAAPDAALLILGPLDGTRLPSFVKGEARAQAPCRPLSANEQANYEALLAKDNASLARWHEPPKLDVGPVALATPRRPLPRDLLGFVGGHGGAVQHRPLGEGGAPARTPRPCAFER